MQLLCKHSEEGNTKGLGVFDVDVKRFSNAVKVPHIGWNTIQNLQSNLLKEIPENSFMYSVHSYYASIGTQTIASSEYELEFSAALQSDNFYGVQFHPEKSSKDGAQLLQNFLNL
jgi:glutamine amidotransferase